ncbi:hypothetical protein HY061_01895 [Candidatus Azambacteria bacterium]|nr:hypothetical protein [Candidatus Azambacteria bacterium]
MAKGSILLKILTVIGDRTIDLCDMVDIYLSTTVPRVSIRKMENMLYERQSQREKERFKREDQIESRRRLKIYISKLKGDGLIEQTRENKILLTSKGLEKLQRIKFRPCNQEFEIEKSSRIIIFSFDIPEKYRKQRNWLREVLKFLNFELVHQSTWVGKIRIPEELLEKLEEMRILKYIKIFEVTKIGTLKELN